MPVIIQRNTTTPGLLYDGRTRQWLAHKENGTASSSILENYFEENGFVPEHFHTVEELLVCLRGAGQIIADGVRYDFHEGSVAIIPPRVIHKVLNAGKEVMRMLAFFPTPDPDCIWLNRNNGNQLEEHVV